MRPMPNRPRYGEKSIFDANGLLTKRVDTAGNETTYTYIDADGDGQTDEIKTIVDPSGRTTTYDYTEPVSLCQNVAHLSPRGAPGQTCHETSLSIEPEPAVLVEQVDYFGNPATFEQNGSAGHFSRMSSEHWHYSHFTYSRKSILRANSRGFHAGQGATEGTRKGWLISMKLCRRAG